jgi:hypothetical protein
MWPRAVQPLENEMMRRHFWRRWPHKTKERPDAPEQLPRKSGSEDRRKLLKALSAMAGGTALFSYSRRSEAKDASDLPPPKRALTGRDEAGRSVSSPSRSLPRSWRLIPIRG